MIHFSLFSGIGGFELAAEWMGWRNYLSCEINEFGNKVREHYWPNAYHHKDIHTLNYASINEQLSTRYGLGWRDDDIILTGGFPCQPYSAAGKRLGKEDSRHLWPEMLRVISEVKPTYIVGENVYGLTNWNGGVVFEEVCADLENLGYEVQPVLLPASGIGAPHHRMRVWFVAYANVNESQCNSGADTSTSGEVRREGQGNVSGELCSDGDAPHPDISSARTPGEGTSIEGNGSDINIQQSEWRSTTQLNNRPPSISRDAADTDSRRISGHGREGQGQQLQATEFDEDNCQQFRRVDWKQFPTVTPICSRNDGLSDRLDGITFSKWRNESIKAAGNAIVPQVVYQIFKSIEQCRPPSTSPSTHGKTTP